MATHVPAEAVGHIRDSRTQETGRIFAAAQSCEQLFSKYATLCSPLSDFSASVDLQHQRFDIWASYLGVFAPFNASLDKRLEYSDEIQSLIVQMLFVLQKNLAFLVSTDCNAAADDKVTTTSGLEGTPSQALEAIESSINRLNRLGVAVRKHSVSSLDERINAFTQRHGDEDYTQLARHIIQFKYKTATASLQEHLALSMASRHQKLRYLHRHQSKLASQINTPSKRTGEEKNHPLVPLAARGEMSRDENRRPFPTVPKATIAFKRQHLDHSKALGERSETNASKFAPTPSVIARLRRGDSDSVVSSSNDSLTLMEEALEDYPEPPECKPHQPEPSCPYCCRPLETRERLGVGWVSHVNKDLCPFVCLSEKCTRVPLSFKDFNTWAKHMREIHTAKWPQQIHKPLIWACDIDHDMEEFYEKDQFLRHLASQHSDCTDEEKHAITESCQIPRKRGRNICPICGYDLTKTESLGLSPSGQRGPRNSAVDELTQLELMEKHVAGHLRRLAIDSSRNLRGHMDHASEASLITSEPGLGDRDTEIRCPSGADLLGDIPLEFVDMRDGSRGSSQQTMGLFDRQWSHLEIKVLFELPKDLSLLAAEEWSRIRQDISTAADEALRTTTPDKILEKFRDRARKVTFQGAVLSPASRNDFEIAIICTLPLEYDAVCHLVDEFWEGNYGRAAGDPNEYTNGRIGPFNIVIVLLPVMGKVMAASATASLQSSYPNLELALVTGICGGIPMTGTGEELILGDVVISNAVVQFDLGRQYPDGFKRKNPLNDSLDRPALHVRNLLATFKTSRGLQSLERQAAAHLKTLQSLQLGDNEAANYDYPGAENDHLYPTSYLHKHSSTEACRECSSGPGAVCNASRKLSCRELGCDVQQRVPRKRLQDSERLRVPQVLVGRLGSGDTVLKSGADRDRIAKEHDVIAFEIEGPGAWGEIPCIIVKGICDYTDSHKNKNWQNFAAATAASVAKALVENHETIQLSSDARRIPYDRNENFIPRPDIHSKLDLLLPFNSDEFHSAALWGLGGSGKTQIALEYTYGRCRDPDCSVFWVHADTEATFTQDYKTIAGILGLGSRLEGSELLVAVRRGIESQKRWVLVVDNADDLGLFGVGQTSGRQQVALLDSIPKGPNGTVLWTSRDQRVDGTLVGPRRGIQVAKMTFKESRRLLEKWRRQETPNEEVQEVELLLEELQWLPLAISQAGAYLYRTGTSVSEYLSQLKGEIGRWRVLGEDEFDQHRRSDAQNSVLRTLAISIRRLKQDSKTAYMILHVLAFVDNQNIPMELLAAAARYRLEAHTTRPGPRREQALPRAVSRLKDFPSGSASPSLREQVKMGGYDELEPALRRLRDFSFMTEHWGSGERRTFEMHKLVQDAARYGLKTQPSPGQDEGSFAKVALHVLDGAYPQETWHNNHIHGDCERYLAHALRVCDWAEIHGMEQKAYHLQSRICNFLYLRGRWKEHRLASETKLRLARNAFGQKHRKSIHAMLGLGWSFHRLNKRQGVEDCATTAMMLAQETLGNKDVLTLECKRLLAALDSKHGRFEQGKQLLTEILDDARQFLNKDHHVILSCMDELAAAHLDLGEYDEAEELLPRLLKLRQDKYGQSHPRTLTVLSRLGNLRYYQGRYDDEAEVQSALLDLDRQSLGNEHPDTLLTMFNLAESQRNRGKKEEAVELLQECSRLSHKVLGANNRRTKDTEQMLEIWEHEDAVKSIITREGAFH